MSSDQDKYHAYCLDCGRKFPDSWGFSNSHLGAGNTASCTTCGGVVTVLHEDNAGEEIKRAKAKRGI